MTHDELNLLLKTDKIPISLKTLRTLIAAGFTHLQPTNFEAFILELFEALNFSGSLTPSTGDEGIDIFLRSTDETIAVQCKKYDENTTVGSKELREFLGALIHAKAVHGYFVTTSSFSSQAKDFSNNHKNITLIDGECIKKLFCLSIMSSISEYEKINIYKDIFKKKEEPKDIIDFGEQYRIKAEELHKDYVRELERLKEKFKPKKFEIK
jgi:restriction endonuclease Mrr